MERHGPAGTGRQAIASMETPIGPVGLQVAAGRLCGVALLAPDEAVPAPAVGALMAEVMRQLRAYFDDPSFVFDLPLAMAGSDFQRRVWRALRAIPSGEVVSYGELARRLGSGARAVGNACRRNPLPLVVPCHRVVGASGIGGYSGAAGGERLAIKRWLLSHEGLDY